MPYALGSRPRFVFEGIGAGGSRSYTYQLGSDTRGRYTVGPLRVRVADSFGLVSITRAFTSTSVLTVTPRIIPLARPPLGGYWLGDSEDGRRSIAAVGRGRRRAPRLPHRGQPAPGALAVHRAVRRADGPPRGAVLAEHGVAVPRLAARRRTPRPCSSWRSRRPRPSGCTWRARGSRPGSSPRRARCRGRAPFRDTLLDTLAVLRPSRAVALDAGAAGPRRPAAGSSSRCSATCAPAQARELAAARRGSAPGVALILAEDGAAADAGRAGPGGAPGWRVAVVPDAARLAAAWQELYRTAAAPVDAAGPGRSGRMASHRRTAAAAAAVILASVSLYPIFIRDGSGSGPGCGAVAVVGAGGHGDPAAAAAGPPCLLAGRAGAAALPQPRLRQRPGRCTTCCPRPRRWRRCGTPPGQGFNEASAYAPPVPELRGMVLLAAAGIGIAALLTDLIAVRLGSAALAGLPLLLLFTEPFTLSVSRGFLGTTVAFCAGVAGYLALLSSEARDRIRDWEHAGTGRPATRRTPGPWRRRDGGSGSPPSSWRCACRWSSPGCTSPGCSAGQPGHRRHGRARRRRRASGLPQPEHAAVPGAAQQQGTHRADLHVDRRRPRLPADLRARQAHRRRLVQLFGQPESLVPVSPRLPAAPGLTASASHRQRDHARRGAAAAFDQDDLGALPVPYPATTVTARGTVRADRSTLMVFDPGVALGGLNYTVTSLAESPDRGRAQRRGAAAGRHHRAHYLSVPVLATTRSAPLAAVRHVQAGAKTQFQEAVALQNWLASSGTFSYTLNAPDGARRGRPDAVPRRDQDGVLPAVLLRHGGARPAARHPLAGRRRVHLGHQGHQGRRHLAGHHPRRARLAGAVLPGLRLAAVRADAVRRRRRPGHRVRAVLHAGSASSGRRPGRPPTAAASSAPSAAGDRRQPGELGDPAERAPAAGRRARRRRPCRRRRRSARGRSSAWCWRAWSWRPRSPPGAPRRVVRRRRWRSGRGRAGPGARRAGRGPADRVRARDIAWAHAAWQELRDDLIDYGAGYRPSESPRAAAARAGDRLQPGRARPGRRSAASPWPRSAPGTRPPRPTAPGCGRTAPPCGGPSPPRCRGGARWRARLLPPPCSAGRWARSRRRATWYAPAAQCGQQQAPPDRVRRSPFLGPARRARA